MGMREVCKEELALAIDKQFQNDIMCFYVSLTNIVLFWELCALIHSSLSY